MVSFKGKVPKSIAMATRILDESQAPKNKEDLKMAADPSSRKAAGKIAMAGSRKSVPLSSSAVPSSQINVNRFKGKAQGMENAVGKRESSVKGRGGRKPLADVSNLNNKRSNQSRNELSNNPKIKLAGINISQGKTTIGSSIYRPRVSLAKSIVVANASSKPVRENMTSTVRAIARLTMHAEPRMRRKTSTEIDSYQGHQHNVPTDSSRPIKNQGVKLFRPRLSLATQKAMDVKSLSRKPIGSRATNINANSKLRKSPMTKQNSDAEKSITAKPCENKASCSGDDESVSSRGCSLLKVESDGNTSSRDNVTAIITRPKCNRRKSYTSSLVARSEMMGEFAECASSIKKDELRTIDDNTNPLDVVEYVDDIYQYYWTMEVQNPLPADYMARQSEITPRMRGILVNWLIDVHSKFHLMQETLFLMVQLLDRVLSVVPTKKDEFQMVGLTALLLASKYEDYWHPKISELISISANSCMRDQMLAMETLVLRKLSFRLNLPTPYVFMLRFLKSAQSDKELEHLAFYLIELCLGEHEALKYRPSLLCASAIYVSRCTLQITPAWTGLLKKHARYEESQLRDCAKMILRFHKAACRKPAQVTHEKYLSPDRSGVAALTALNVLPL